MQGISLSPLALACKTAKSAYSLIMLPKRELTDITPKSAARHIGFSLIEAAIVLGIIGLVLGGIWIATSSITQARKINDMASAYLQIASNTRRLIPISNYPTTATTSTYITNTLSKAGVLPGDYAINTSTQIASGPSGANFRVFMVCWTGSCPALGIAIFGPSSPVVATNMTIAECNQLVRKLFALDRDTSNVMSVQIASTTNVNYQLLYPPFNASSVNCPSNLSYITVLFQP